MSFGEEFRAHEKWPKERPYVPQFYLKAAPAGGH